MPVADIDGAEIHYEVIGQHGPWMTAIPGGRHPLCEVEDLASGLADHGFRVLTHDRRNCGRSSLSFDGSKAEEDIWVEDLRRLLDVIGIDRTSLVGRSRSSRMAVWFSLSHPTRTHGIGLWGFSGGAAAARLLDDYYYGQYIRACENGGMAAVCSLDHFAGIIDRDPGKRHALLALNPDEFIATMRGWRSHFMIDIDAPVMGLPDTVLSSIDVPTVILPYYDHVHPWAVARHAHQAIPGSRLIDFDPTRHDQRIMSPVDIARDSATVARTLWTLLGAT
ncbi:alpha/beta fold hydrolase [Actinomycetota bacterium]